MSKCDNQKLESTRRTIFNRGSTLQFIVQISSGSVNSSVRARSKTHGRTPASIELPRGRHLGSNACIFWARTPASPLRKSAQHLALNAYIFYAQECTQVHGARAHNQIAHERTHTCARQETRASLTCTRQQRCAHPACTRQEMHAHTCVRLKYARPPARRKDACEGCSYRDARLGLPCSHNFSFF